MKKNREPYGVTNRVCKVELAHHRGESLPLIEMTLKNSSKDKGGSLVYVDRLCAMMLINKLTEAVDKIDSMYYPAAYYDRKVLGRVALPS